MGARSSALDNRSMAQRWMEAGVGLVYSSDTIDQTDGGFNVDKATAVSAMLQGIDTGSYTVGSFKTYHAAKPASHSICLSAAAALWCFCQ